MHRPRYDDWSLPKGKLEPREPALLAAVREVGEELGATVAVSCRLTRIEYDVAGDRKEVHFWAMRETGGEFAPDDEVDDVRWLPPHEVRGALSYDVERDVLDVFTSRRVPDSVVVLVRHARAGKRAEWHGDDNDRPLDDVGMQQAERLATFLRVFAPDRIVAAQPLRCVQTAQPLARDLGLEVVVDGTLGDAAFLAEPDGTLAAVRALAEPGRVTLVSSQGDAIPGLVERLVPDVASTVTKKGAAWVIGFTDGEPVSADYYPHAAR